MVLGDHSTKQTHCMYVIMYHHPHWRHSFPYPWAFYICGPGLGYAGTEGRQTVASPFRFQRGVFVSWSLACSAVPCVVETKAEVV